MQKPEVHFESRHESGNVFAILGLVRAALRKQRRINEYNELRDKVLSQAGSYEEALAMMREHVALIDDDGIYNQG